MMRLADVAMVLIGVPPRTGGDGAARYVQIKDLTVDRRDLAKGPRPTAKRAQPIQVNDVLVAARSERGLVMRPDEELVGAFVGLDVYLVRPNLNRVDPNYLASFLSLPKVVLQLRAAATGTSPPRLPKEALNELRLPVPPLDRQRTIGRLARTMAECRDLSLRRQEAESRLFDRYLEDAFAQLR